MGESAKRQPSSRLQETFLKRVKEEMAKQGLVTKDGPNTNALSKRLGAPKQRTAYGVLYENADPSLKTVEEFANGLGLLHPWRLLVDPDPFVSGQPPNLRQVMRGGDLSQIPTIKTGPRAKPKRERKE